MSYYSDGIYYPDNSFGDLTFSAQFISLYTLGMLVTFCIAGCVIFFEDYDEQEYSGDYRFPALALISLGWWFYWAVVLVANLSSLWSYYEAKWEEEKAEREFNKKRYGQDFDNQGQAFTPKIHKHLKPANEVVAKVDARGKLVIHPASEFIPKDHNQATPPKPEDNPLNGV